MANNNIITIIIAIIFALTLSIPLFKILKSKLIYFSKIKIESKSGETVELNFNKRNDVDTVINFADIFLGLK